MNIEQQVIDNLKSYRDWVKEVNDLALLIEYLESRNKQISVRTLAKLTRRSKTWVGVSLILIKGLKLYPEIEQIRNRNAAYNFLQRKNKLQRFMES